MEIDLAQRDSILAFVEEHQNSLVGVFLLSLEEVSMYYSLLEDMTVSDTHLDVYKRQIGLFVLSTCMPYLNRWCGEVWGQCFWNEYHMLWYFSGYLGLSLIHI